MLIDTIRKNPKETRFLNFKQQWHVRYFRYVAKEPHQWRHFVPATLFMNKLRRKCEKKKLIQNQQDETRGGVLHVHKMIKLPGGDVNTNGDEEYSDESKEDDSVDQYGNSTCLHVCKFHHSAISRQLE
ncbi:hypothetical protein F2P56_021504 [Juglans regia]|uniref:Uncharacterized protein n=1 Tax=Juglans regia TaxID=51240 RepID=A0A833TY37_JUGRE|nr:hypothetical protein F2P56_021504 [Juglans regia]